MSNKPDYTKMDLPTLTAAISENREARKAIFAKGPDATIADVDEAEALTAAADEMAVAKAALDSAAEEAGKRFAAAQAKFASETKDDEESDEDDEDAAKGKKDKPFASDAEGDEGDESEGDEGDEGDESEGDDGDEGDEGDESEGEDGEVVTASADPSKGLKIKASGSTARKVGARRPKRSAKDTRASADVVITASTGVEDFEPGERLNGMEGVTKALFSRAKGIPKHNAAAARSVLASNGGVAEVKKLSLAKIGVPVPEAMTASAGNDYSALKAAIKDRADTALLSEAALTAAGWCAPSTPVYSYISDYVVDGLITVPEVSAPRGGLLMTTGPARSSQGAALGDFGFTQTEAQAEAGVEKQIEVIECPTFEDHRLDAIGYGYTIPLLTQKAYPELVTDTLRFAGVLWQHKVNQRVINDIVAMAVSRTFSGLGAAFTDALEAMALLAVKERRKWNLGENAIIEAKVPQFVKEIYRADMSRRDGVAYDSVTDAQIAKHFTDRRIAVEYVSDWQELSGENVTVPATYDVLMYPSGTVIKAIEDVVNLSAIYDAASLVVNEYMGVFFEQGILVAKAGYGVSKVTLPTNRAGRQGILNLGATA